jgi:HSP20 family protein
MDWTHELREMERRMNLLMREMLRGEPRLALPTGETTLTPFGEAAVGVIRPFSDIEETDGEIVVTAEVPGVEKKDININATEDSLEISAEKKEEKKEEKKGYLMWERSHGRYHRFYTLPSKVDPNKIKAIDKNGLLEVRLPKVEAKKKVSIAIE